MSINPLHLLVPQALALSGFGSTLPTFRLHPCVEPTDDDRAQNFPLGATALRFHATEVLRKACVVARHSPPSKCSPAILLSLKRLPNVASSNNPALTPPSPPLLKLTHVVRSCSSATSGFLASLTGKSSLGQSSFLYVGGALD